MRKGFTLIELLVVIAVIGILATLVVAGFSTIQSTSRDSERSAKMAVIQAALEKYYDANGEYPNCYMMGQSITTIASSTLVGIDPTVLTAPLAAAGTNSFTKTNGGTTTINCSDLTAGDTSDPFAYVGDGSTTCTSTSGAGSCLNYTLEYIQESDKSVVKITSRHTAQLATSGASTLTATATSSSASSLSWTTVGNATSYQVERALDSGFTTGVTTLAATTGTTQTDTSLSPGTQYFYEVTPYNNGSPGAASNTAMITTPIDAPAAYTISSSSTYNTLTATANSICETGTTPYYTWTANGAAWKSGASYQTVSDTIANGTSVTLASSTTCTTPQASSASTSASNTASLTWAAPYAYIGTIAYRTIGWGGTCPSGTTSENFYWRLSGGSINASGNASGPGSYANTGVAWGNGGANVTLSCYGPWGTLTATGWGTYGSACVPTVTESQCYG